MATKAQVLKVLEEDLAKKRLAIQSKYQAKIARKNDALKKAEEKASQILEQRIKACTKGLPWATTNPDRYYVLNNSYLFIKRDMSKYPPFKKADEELRAACKIQNEEIGTLNERGEEIRRKILLYGLNDEVLALLESL